MKKAGQINAAMFDFSLIFSQEFKPTTYIISHLPAASLDAIADVDPRKTILVHVRTGNAFR